MRAALLILATLLPPCNGIFGFIGSKQTIAATGTVACYGVPTGSVEVRLVDSGWCEFVRFYMSNVLHRTLFLRF